MKNMIAAFFLVAAVAGRAQAFGLHELNIAVQSVGGSCPSAATQIIAPDPAVVGPIYPASTTGNSC